LTQELRRQAGGDGLAWVLLVQQAWLGSGLAWLGVGLKGIVLL